MRYVPVIFLVFISACTLHYPPRTETINQFSIATVESYEKIGTAEINNIIEQAIANGETWPHSPALIAFKTSGGDQEIRTYHLWQEANRAENPDIIESILIRDGFLDDSVRGDWHKFTFTKEPDNTWRVVKLQKAFRCWRQDPDLYRAGPCL